MEEYDACVLDLFVMSAESLSNKLLFVEDIDVIDFLAEFRFSNVCSS